jgi:hypothetical protein
MGVFPGDPGYLAGVPIYGDVKTETSPEPDQGPATRTLGRAAIDTILKAGSVVPELGRTATTVARDIADTPGGWAEQADKAMKGIGDWYENLQSQRARDLAKESFFPGVDDKSAWQDLGAVGMQQAAGLAPWIIAGLLSGGTAWAGKLINIGGMGAQQLGAFNSKLRDSIDGLSLDQIQKLPGGQDELDRAGGDINVAKNNLYKKAYDPLLAAANAGLGALGGAGLGRMVGTTGITRLLPRVAAGTAEGATMFGGLSGVGEYSQQAGEKNIGMRSAIDVEKVVKQTMEGAIPGAAIMGGLHVFPHSAEVTTGIGADQAAALKALPAPDTKLLTYQPGPGEPPPPPPAPPPQLPPPDRMGPIPAEGAPGPPSGPRASGVQSTLDDYAKTLGTQFGGQGVGYERPGVAAPRGPMTPADVYADQLASITGRAPPRGGPPPPPSGATEGPGASPPEGGGPAVTGVDALGARLARPRAAEVPPVEAPAAPAVEAPASPVDLLGQRLARTAAPEVTRPAPAAEAPPVAPTAPPGAEGVKKTAQRRAARQPLNVGDEAANIKNGQAGTIEKIDNGWATIRLDSGNTVGQHIGDLVKVKREAPSQEVTTPVTPGTELTVLRERPVETTSAPSKTTPKGGALVERPREETPVQRAQRARQEAAQAEVDTLREVKNQDILQRWMDELPKDPSGAPAKPEYYENGKLTKASFDHPDAQEARKMFGLPKTWGAFVNAIRSKSLSGRALFQAGNFLEQGRAVVRPTGRVLVGGKARQDITRTNKRETRETATAEALDEGRQSIPETEHAELIKQAGSVAQAMSKKGRRVETRLFPTEAGREATPTTQARAGRTGEHPKLDKLQARLRGEEAAAEGPPDEATMQSRWDRVMQVAERVNDLIKRQVEAVHERYEQEAEAHRQRGEYKPGESVDAVFKPSNPKRPRSGAKEYPVYSRYAQLNRLRWLLSGETGKGGLLAQAYSPNLKLRTAARRQILVRLMHWAADEKGGIEAAHAARMESSERMTEARQEKLLAASEQAEVERTGERPAAVDQIERASEELAKHGGDDFVGVFEIKRYKLDAIDDINEERMKRGEEPLSHADMLKRAAPPLVDLAKEDPELFKIITRTREREGLNKEQQGEVHDRLVKTTGRVPGAMAEAMVRAGAIDADTAENLLKTDSGVQGYAQEAERNMSNRMEGLLHKIANELDASAAKIGAAFTAPRERTLRLGQRVPAVEEPREANRPSRAGDLNRVADELRQLAKPEGRGRLVRASEAVAKITDVMDKYRNHIREDVQNEAVQWVVDNHDTATALRQINQIAPGAIEVQRGETTPTARTQEPARAGEGLAASDIRRQQQVTGVGGAAAPKPAELPAPDRGTARAAVNELAQSGPVQSMQALSRLEEDGHAQVSSVAKRSEIYDRNDEIDQHLSKVAKDVAGDVPIIELHPDVYDELAPRIDRNMVGSRAYYDYKNDRIYAVQEKAKSLADVEEHKQLLRHETGHAITYGALQDPAARGAFTKLTDIIRKKERQWSSMLSVEARRDVLNKLSDVDEFVAELQGDKDFRRIMSAVPITGEERAQLRTPKARTVLEAAKEWAQRALRKLFAKNGEPDNALTNAMVMSFDLMEDIAAKGRPEYREGQGRGAPSKIGDAAKELGNRASYAWRQRGFSLPFKAFWAHSFKDLTNYGPQWWKDAARKPFDAVAELEGARHRIAIDRGDEKLIKSIAKQMNLPQAGKVADFLMRESKHGAYVDEALGTGRNKHVDPKDVGSVQHVENHPKLKAEFDALDKAMPRDVYNKKGELVSMGFKSFRKMLHDWGERTSREDTEAMMKQAARMDDITNNATNTGKDATAVSALTKRLMNDTNFTPAEKAWIDRQRPDPKVLGRPLTKDERLQGQKFNAMVAGYREFDQRKKGPWLPFKRHGDFAISGNYQFPKMAGIKELGDGMFEATSEQAARDYIKLVNQTTGVKLLHHQRRVYEAGTDTEAMEPGESHQFMGGPTGEPGYVETVKRGLRRVSPAKAEGDAAYDVRHQLHFNDRHVEFFRKAYDAQQQLDKLMSNRNLKMRPNIERVSEPDAYQSPHFMSAAMRTVMDRMQNSWEFKRMTPAEQRAWSARMTTEGAKQVLAAGGHMGGLQREYVEGMSRDLLENYAEASTQSAANLAHLTKGQAIRDGFEQLEKLWQDNRFRTDVNMGQLRSVMEEMQARAFQTQDPFVHSILGSAVNRLLQMTYTSKLAGTSFLGINMSEPTLIGLPMLAGKYGAWAATKAMRSAYHDLSGRSILGAGIRDMMKAVKNKTADWNDYAETIETNLKKSGATADELALFKVLADRMMFDRSSINEISLLREPSPSAAGRALDYVDNIFRGMNNSVEVLNRSVLALTAYRLERARGGSHEKAITAAEDAVYEGAGQYGAWNSPPVFNHPAGRLAFQFKKYSQRIISNYVRAAVGAAKGDKEKLKQLGYMMGMVTLAAGVGGLPTEPFKVVADALYIAGIGPSWDEIMDMGYRQIALASPGAAEMFWHGLPRGLDVEVSGRIGHNTLVFGPGSPTSRKPKDLISSAGSVLLGAPGSTASNIISGAQNLSKAISESQTGSAANARRYALEALRDFVPIKQFGDIIDAYQKSDGGLRTRGGAMMAPEYNSWQAVMKSLGFQPANEARFQEQRRVEQRETGRAKESKQDWLSSYATATPAEKPTIAANIKQWNDTHSRAEQITEADKIRATAQRRKQEARPAGEFGLPENKRYRERHAELSKIYATQ